MARRAGKAANRKARQRAVQRQARRPLTPPPQSVPTPAAPAREPASAPSQSTPSRSAPGPTFGGGSTLTMRERAEYHYVERDLRNIGMLTVLMAVLLLLAYIAANALNLV